MDRLTKDEQAELMMMQMSPSGTKYGGYLPDDCSECGVCGEPILGTGWCQYHYKRFDFLVRKAIGQ